MKLRNFTKFFTGIALISALPVGVVISNPHTHTHSSLVVENKATNDINWSIDDNGNIWPTDRSKVSGAIEIPSVWDGKHVTGIANYAFTFCNKLISITIPNSVTSIGNAAFWRCSSLKTIAIPSGVTSIGDWAFQFCSGLTSINIPNSVTSIGKSAFNGCSSLTSVNFDNDSQLTSIGENAFKNCTSLTSIDIPNSVTSIGRNAFNQCTSLTNVYIPSSVTIIGGEAFSYCPLTSIEFAGNQTYDWVPTAEGGNTVGGYIIQKGNDLSTNTVVGCLAYGKINIKLPDGKTSIIGNAFSCCSGITHIGISDNVTNIGWTAFWNCTSLTSIIIPSSITSIGKTAFGNCDKMGTITFNWNEEQLSKLTLGTDLFDNTSSSQKINFHIPWGTKDQYNAKFTQDILGTNVTANWIDDIQWSITDDGFISPANKDLIKGDVTIPNTVGGKVVTGIANDAFDSCTSLTSVNFDNDSQLTSIGESAFDSCSSLTSVTIPSGLTQIGPNAFDNCVKLTAVNFTDDSKLNNIDDEAFDGCTSLTSINIPSSVTSIGEAAFADCPLTSIKFTDNDTYKRVSTKSKDGEEIGAYVISKSQDLSTSTVAGCLAYGKINIELPDGKTSIIDNAFDWCSALTSINIPSSVTSIGDTAFSRCSSLKSVNFAEGSKLNSIGDEAFQNCSSLTSITIPSSVTSIGGRAFEDCYNLSDVYLNWDENQIKKLQIDDYVFDSTTKKITINFHIPKGMKELYIAKTKGWFNGSAVPNWIENNPPAPSSNSNLPLILGLTFGFIILIGIGSYLGYRYYKHRKAINKK